MSIEFKSDHMGKLATDKITGFTGRVTGYGEYLTCTSQYQLTPEGSSTETKRKPEWFDAARLTFDDSKPLILG